MGRTITFFSFLFLTIANLHAQLSDKDEEEKFKTDVKQLYQDKSYNEEKFIHYKALNIIFNREINKLLTEASDLSTRAAFATLEEENNRLTLGYSINPNNKTTSGTDYIRYIWSMGIQADIEDNFSSLSVDSEIQNDIGVFVKFTQLFHGNIGYTDKAKIKKFRDEYLLDQALSYKYDKYKESQKETDLTIEKKKSLDPTINTEDEYNNAYTAAVKNTYNETLIEEAETITKGKYIKALRKTWWSARIYMPISTTEYEVFKEESSPSSETKSFYPLSLEGSFSYYRKSMRIGTMQFTGSYNGFMNNSIAANILKEITFTSLPNNTPTTPVELSTQNKYIGEFDSFITHNLKGDFVYFYRDFPVGLSASFDYSFGEYEASTWKIGIPFYLKGKNDDSAISVELQWREIHEKTLSGKSTHALGFSIGIPFGNYVNQ
ncbi:hypothetical protein SAMN04487910_0392 [Aquimarina amphilecti]|uniref:Uncharacterized protein n=1 Tax=Aquimarina amphilecti TaxID=1038014 RepID=A0A1H7GJ15_AQUAM|nr:hypothetical protein [Aquimarina amphilecti]SEK38156.1 hypothetical protein SAMN04487910_0392 [Aquimarina amphilecti]